MNKLKIKTVVFLSNYFNHHQKPFSDAMFERLGDGYTFIETEKMSEERLRMGWRQESYPNYVVTSDLYHSNIESYAELIFNADIVIFGSAPSELLKRRIKENKIIFRYSERPLKSSQGKWKYFIRLFTWRKFNPQRSNLYMLCASAYTAADFAQFGLFRGKTYKWGYFPELKQYDDIDQLINAKKPSSILWVARLIELKHPEASIEVAKCLKADGYQFTLNIIGNGVLENQLRKKIQLEHLDDCVHMLGSMMPEQVRKYMEESEIFLFTSDRNEGWGAVLNESMNSACAVVASHAIGSVPFLIKDKENGLIYKDGDIEDLYRKTKYYMDNRNERERISRNAFLTMASEWNAENATDKFIQLANKVMDGEINPNISESGVCSRAEVIKDDWYKK